MRHADANQVAEGEGQTRDLQDLRSRQPARSQLACYALKRASSFKNTPMGLGEVAPLNVYLELEEGAVTEVRRLNE